MIRPGRLSREVALSGVALVLANLFIWTTNHLIWQSLGALVLAGALPGTLLPRSLYAEDDSLDPVERALLTLGLGYVCLLCGMLFLHYLPGPLTRKLVVAAYDVLVVALLLLRVRSGPGPRRASLPPGTALAILVLILIAGASRLPNLGYSEFQGDEVAVLHVAAASIQGRDDALFLHKKGPAEILVPTLTYAVSRRINEAVARFPFALASLAGVVGVYALGKRLSSHRGGWWAALLVALNGFLVAFGRIVQYQSLVLLFSVLGLLCALRFSQEFRRRDLWLSAVFLAAGMLAHSDTVFAAMSAGFIILRAVWVRRVPLRKAAAWLIGPMLVAGAMLAAFYVPFALHPHFEATREYLKWRQGEPPYNNLRHFLNIGTVYNAVYYVALMALGLGAAALNRLSRIGRPRWLVPALFLGAFALAGLRPEITRVGERDFVGTAFAALFVLLFFARDSETVWRPVLLWSGVPFLIYLFLFRDPRTHLYVLFPGAALLLGTELDRVASRLRGGAWVCAGALALVMVVSGAYLYMMFVSHRPEYKRTYPAHRIAFFCAPYGEKMPEQGLFGFPYRAGWKVVGKLYASGELQGDYGTNEETHITMWYTRGKRSCNSQPRYYLLAEDVQDEQPVSMGEVASAYELVGQVWAGDRVKLRMYERKPARLPYREYYLSRVASLFDREFTDPDYATGLAPLDPLAEIQHPAHLRVGEGIEFLGHRVDKTRMHPGDALTLTLYWRADSPIDESYTVFTHIEDPGVVWAQKDNIPCCDDPCPTNEWEAGAVYVDRYTLVLGPETPAGPHALVAGMYRADTMKRLPVMDLTGAQLGDVLDLGVIEVVAR